MLKIAGRILNIVVWSGIVVLVLLMFVLPLVITLLYRFDCYPGKTGQWWLMLFEQAQVHAMRVFCLVWIFFVGGCFASFLNVVAWRVPRGKSILGSSHCPKCNIKLNFRNNLPILGWMRNGGRCANCELPIPVRYLFAEITLGATFLIMFLAQTVSGGMTIPFRTPNDFIGIENILFDPKGDLLMILGFQLTLLSLIFTFAIAATEKFRAPISLVVFGIIAAFGFQAAYPPPGIVDFRLTGLSVGEMPKDFVYLMSSPWQFVGAMGFGIAAACGCFLAIRLSSKVEPVGGFACLLLAGVFLGWQSVLSTTILYFLLAAFKFGNVPGKLLVATLVHLCLWRVQTYCQWWPGPASGLTGLLSGAVYIGVLGFAVSLLPAKPQKLESDATNDLSGSITDLE